MKITKSTAFFTLMSSFLVLGLNTQDVALKLTDEEFPPVAGAADIWADDTVTSQDGTVDKRLEDGADDVTDFGDSQNENVIVGRTLAEKPKLDGLSPEHKPQSSSSKKSVISSKSQKMAPVESRDHDMPPETSDLDDRPSKLSQLSKSERAQVVKNLEASFLNIIGLKSRPKPNGDVTVPQYMLDLYRQHIQGHQGRRAPSKYNKGLYNSNTIRSFFHIEDQDKHPENVVRLKFNVSSIPGPELLQAAELRLYREASNHNNQQHIVSSADDQQRQRLDELLKEKHRIDVHQVIRPPTRGQGAVTRLIDTRVVNPAKSSWESFDIAPAVHAWRQDNNHGLEIHFSKVSGEPSPLKHVRLKRSTRPLREQGYSDEEEEKNWAAQKPLLVTYSQDPAGKPRHSGKKEHRKKRNTEHKKDKKDRKKRSKKARRKRKKGRPRKDRDYKKNCRRRPLYVDFHDVGWTDWIVAPPGYEAYYCYGECPFHLADHFNTTNHAVVQQFVHSVDPQAVPKPCCVPTELGQVALLYIDEQGKVVLKNYKEMVVTACGCR